MLLMSPELEGSRMVLDSLARLEKADTYCSATLREAAAFPFWGETTGPSDTDQTDPQTDRSLDRQTDP